MRSADVGRDVGYVTPAFVACVGLTMVLLVMAANAYVVHYARGVLQSAVEEGARQGAAVDDAVACTNRIRDVVGSGLGTMSDQVDPPSCLRGPQGWLATVDATFDGWLPGMPSTATHARASVALPGGPG